MNRLSQTNPSLPTTRYLTNTPQSNGIGRVHSAVRGMGPSAIDDSKKLK